MAGNVHPLIHQVRAVAFDAVGTVLFPVRPIAEVYADAIARHAGFRPDPAAVRSALWEQYRREEEADRLAGWATSEARERRRWSDIVTAVARAVAPDAGGADAVFAELYAHYARPDSWSVPADAAATFAALAGRGLTLALGSNYDTRLESVLAGTPALAPLSRHVLISSQVGWRKPSPRFFEAVTRELAVPAGDVLFVGDDVGNDYEGAMAAGMRALLLGPEGRHQVEAAGRIVSLSELV